MQKAIIIQSHDEHEGGVTEKLADFPIKSARDGGGGGSEWKKGREGEIYGKLKWIVTLVANSDMADNYALWFDCLKLWSTGLVGVVLADVALA